MLSSTDYQVNAVFDNRVPAKKLEEVQIERRPCEGYEDVGCEVIHQDLSG